jgi:hypothetical protein
MNGSALLAIERTSRARAFKKSSFINHLHNKQGDNAPILKGGSRFVNSLPSASPPSTAKWHRSRRHVVDRDGMSCQFGVMFTEPPAPQTLHA